MLIRGQPIIQLVNQFRIVWLQGSYGGGKTLGAYQLAHDLYATGRYRYILGNSNSVWTDSPENVVLRDGSFVDAIVILDEGGLFMRMSRDAEKFMIGLRKLNITILCPSVQPPSTRVKFLQMQRIFNFQVLGLPLWLYQFRLNLGAEREKATFGIWKPSQIFGIYDTLDYPYDDLYLSDWFEYWMVKAKESKPEWCTWGKPPAYKVQRRTGRSGENSALDQLGGIIEEAISQNEELQESLSLHSFEAPTKRARKRI